MLSPTEHRGVCRLLSSVMSGTESHTDREEDYKFLHSMLMEKKLHLLFKIHERLKRLEKRSPIPVQEHAASLASDLLEELMYRGRKAEVKELVSLLSKPHFRSLLSVHDALVQRDFEPALPPVPDGLPEEEEDSVKIVSLVKTKEPLGATIKRDESTGGIVVARIMRGGAADKSGLIHEGDELREVNGVSLEHKKPKEILPLLARSQSEVTFKVIPASTKKELLTKKKLFVRTLFDYDPKEDPTVPCKEAALAFKKGDVIQIVSREDDTWWQARHHGDSKTWAGLVPSQQLHERRVSLQRPKALFKPRHVKPTGQRLEMKGSWEKVKVKVMGERNPPSAILLWFSFVLFPPHAAQMMRKVLANEYVILLWFLSTFPLSFFSSFLFFPVMEDVDYGAITGIHIAGLRRSFRLGRRGSRNREAQSRKRSSGVDGLARTPTYMEVVPYRRDPDAPHRLVLLVGPGGVGVSELKKRLLISDPEHFGVTIPHTTREKRKQEKDGLDYYFVSQHKFEEDIINNRFIEYGRYRGHYYGTGLDSVQQVIAEGKVCLLDVHPNTIKCLYTSEFKPYVVFVKPSRIEELRLTRRRAKFICNKEGKKPARTFSEEDFEDMIDLAESMESQYGHLFDKAVVNGDIATAFRELKADLEKIEGAETQWIPAEWICSSPTEAQSSFDHFTGRI
ncbi:MAGUK p55 subfamily member 7-like [Polymixia lowei]